MARLGSNSSEGRIGLLLLILLSAVLLLTQREEARERRTTPLLTSDLQAPVAAWLGLPFRQLEGTLSDVEEGRRALQENHALRAELVELRAQNDRLKASEARMKRLEALLFVDFKADIPSRRIAARAVSDTASPFVRSVLIGAGKSAGIRDGYPVLSEAGLVGHVVSAGSRSARVLRLDDLNSRVAVESARSGARAILTGLNMDDAGLAFVSHPDDWSIGDRVITSGDDGRLPAGLPVGTVKRVEPFRVALDFHRAPIDWVFVLPFEPLNNEEVEDGATMSSEPGESEQDAVQAEGAG